MDEDIVDTNWHGEYKISRMEMETGLSETMSTPVSGLMKELVTRNICKDKLSLIEKVLDPEKTDEVIDARKFEDHLLTCYYSKSKWESNDGSQSSPIRLDEGCTSLDESFNASCTEADNSICSETSSILRREKTTLNSECESLKAANLRLHAENIRLKELLTQAEDKEAALKTAESEAQRVKVEYASLKETYRSLESSYKALSLESDLSETELKKLTLEIKRKEKSITTLREKNSSLNKDLETKDLTLLSLRAEVEYVQKHAEEMHAECVSLRKHHTDCDQRQRMLKDELMKERLEKEHFQRNLEELTKEENAAVYLKNKWLVEQVEDLQMRLNECQSKCPPLTGDESDADDDSGDDECCLDKRRPRSLSLHKELGSAHILNELYMREKMLEEDLASRRDKEKSLLEEIATLKEEIVILKLECETSRNEYNASQLNLAFMGSQLSLPKSNYEGAAVDDKDLKKLDTISLTHESGKAVVSVVDTISEDSAVESDTYPSGENRLRSKAVVNNNNNLVPVPGSGKVKLGSRSWRFFVLLLLLFSHVSVLYLGMYLMIQVLHPSVSFQRSLLYWGVTHHYEPPPV